MKSTISGRKEVADQTLQVDFDLMGNEVDFEPGQVFHVDLIDPPYQDEKGNHRHFSILNSPNVRGSLSLITRIRDTAFKRSLAEMPLGSEVEISKIGGSFTLPDNRERPLAFVAGGIGITPFVSMSRYIVEEDLDYRVKLLYSNRNRSSSVFIDEFQGYEISNRNFDVILTMTDDPGWPGESRLIDSEFIEDHLEEFDSYVYMVAGPPPMVEAVSREIEKLDIPAGQMVISDFTGY